MKTCVHERWYLRPPATGRALLATLLGAALLLMVAACAAPAPTETVWDLTVPAGEAAETGFEVRRLVLPFASPGETPQRLQIPKVPLFQPIHAPDGSLATVDMARVEKELRSASPGLKLFALPDDESYLLVPHGWMTDLLWWYRSFLFELGLTYEREIWDCDDFSRTAAGMASLSVYISGYGGFECPIGWINVLNKNPWAGVKGVGVHELLLVVTDEGIFVTEPQNGAMVHLSDYPNREYIREVVFE